MEQLPQWGVASAIAVGAGVVAALVYVAHKVDPIETESEDTSRSRQQDVVREAYAKTIEGDAGCCESGPSPVTAVDGGHMGYTPDEMNLAKLGKEGKVLGCGHPVSFANLQAGDTVVDLGCGAGIDCFIASAKVGPEGKVIGVDMTPEMLAAARKTAADDGGKWSNVEFRLGEIEALPLADGTADVVISNCVINLAPDKSKVYAEMFRALKAGGRIAVADVVATKDLPKALLTAKALSC